MFFIIVPALVLLVGIGCLIYSNRSGGECLDGPGITGIFCSVFGGLALLIMSMAIPMNRIEAMATIQQIEMIRASVALARENGREIELAALSPKIAELNGEIALMKYYNTVFDIWLPDEVMNIKPLE